MSSAPEKEQGRNQETDAPLARKGGRAELCLLRDMAGQGLDPLLPLGGDAPNYAFCVTGGIRMNTGTFEICIFFVCTLACLEYDLQKEIRKS